MKILVNISSIIIILLFFSCGMDEKDETELALFYEDNYEFAEKQKHIWRSGIEKGLADGGYYNHNKKLLYSSMIKIDSLSQNIIIQIDSCIKNNSFEKTDKIFNTYTSLLNQIDSTLEGDKNYIIRRFNFNQSNLSSELKLLRVKNDLAIASANGMDYTYMFLNSSCNFGGIEDISTTSYIDSIGNAVITLHSEGLQNLEKGRVVNSLIIDNISKNGRDFKDDFLVLTNDAFADVKLKSLQAGRYVVKGKMRFYGYKGVQDYPFEHQFTIE